jgi:hypothetical protein
MKTCFKCGEAKPLAEFYRHKDMSDGHLNKCKNCTKRDVNEHRGANVEGARARDRARGMLPHRVAAREAYAQTEAGKVAIARTRQNQRVTHADRILARTAVGNAVRDGRLMPLPCLMCGAEAKAHHPDYSRPIDVVWLCHHHHKETHSMARELAR